MFSEALLQVVTTLEELPQSLSGLSASTVSALHYRVCSFNFLIYLTVSDILRATRRFST